jgi:biotin synthase-like enzyme
LLGLLPFLIKTVSYKTFSHKNFPSKHFLINDDFDDLVEIEISKGDVFHFLFEGKSVEIRGKFRELDLQLTTLIKEHQGLIDCAYCAVSNHEMSDSEYDDLQMLYEERNREENDEILENVSGKSGKTRKTSLND